MKRRRVAFIVVTPALAGCLLPISYSERQTKNDGTCFVQEHNNPPRYHAVSCDAPILPPAPDSKWCRVASSDDPSREVSVKCPKQEEPK